jgi:NitT/TauT family transport system substrate-binding protein
MRLVAVLILLLVVSGCMMETELRPTDVKLKWLHQAQFAGNYVAVEKGFYADEGFDVTLDPFDFEQFPIAAVEQREYDFGITGADELILARANGKAQHVRAIAVIYKINPVCLYTLKESGILTPQDLLGKTVGIEKAEDGTDINVGILYRAMLAKLDLPAEEITEVRIGYDATELLAGETDVSSGYIINEPYGVIAAGKEVETILLADYGIHAYADVLIAHEALIDESPEMVASFVRATLKGWQYAIEHEEESVDIVLQYTPESTREHQLYMLRHSIPLIHTGDSKLGVMEPNEWDHLETILYEQGLLQDRFDVTTLYTMEPVNAAYASWRD